MKKNTLFNIIYQKLAMALTGVVAVISIFFGYIQIKKYLDRYLLMLSFALLSIVFCITRLPFFLYYPIPFFAPDSATYFIPVYQIIHGQWPVFALRTPGYPIFSALILILTNRIFYLILAQTVLLFLSAALLTWSVYRYKRYLAFPAALGMAAFLASPFCIGSDFSPLTESIYSSTLIFIVSFLILAIKTKRPLWLFLCSAMLGASVFVRPSALYLVVIYLLIIIHMAAKRYTVKRFIAFISPYPIVLLSLLMYNYFTIGVFSFTNMAEFQSYYITAPYWTPDEDLPENANEIITKFREDMPSEHKKILYDSWNIFKLYPLFLTYILDSSQGKIPHDKGFSNLDGELYGKIGKTAIKKNPVMYIKFITTMFFYHFAFFYYGDETYYSNIPSMYEYLYISKDYPFIEKPYIMWEYTKPPVTPYIKIVDENGIKKITYVPTFLQKLHTNIMKWFVLFVNRVLWVILFFGAFFASVYMLVKTQFKNEAAFILFIITSIELGMATSTYLMVAAIPRYTSPGDFLIFLAPVFSLSLYTGNILNFIRLKLRIFTLS